MIKNIIKYNKELDEHKIEDTKHKKVMIMKKDAFLRLFSLHNSNFEIDYLM